MKPIKISWSESKEGVDSIGLKSWRKAGMEAELQDGDIYLDCFDELRKEIANVLNGGITVNPDYAHLINNQVGYPNGVGPISLPTIDYSAKEKVEKAIEDCKTPHELYLLMGDVAKYGLTKEFINKKKTLQ